MVGESVSGQTADRSRRPIYAGDPLTLTNSLNHSSRLTGCDHDLGTRIRVNAAGRPVEGKRGSCSKHKGHK